MKYICGSSVVVDNIMLGLIYGIYGGDIDKFLVWLVLYLMFERMFYIKKMGVEIVVSD